MYAKRNKTLKALVAVLSMVLVMCLTVAGTLAWLVDETTPVVNTFTTSDVDITLEESASIWDDNDGDTRTNSYKMVPGVDIAKDPKVTVLANSEACWVFVKVEATTNVADFLEYNIDTRWTQVPNTENVYYYQHAATGGSDGTPISVLAGDKVTVQQDVTKGMMDDLNKEGATLPKLTFTAYAIQQAGFATPEAAWAEAQKLG